MTRSFAQLNTDLGGAFGAQAQYAQNLAPITSTSAVFAEFMTLTTAVLAAGTYRIGTAFQYILSAAATEGEARVQIDDAITLVTELLSSGSAGDRQTYASFFEVVLAAGMHDIDIDIRRTTEPGTVTVDDGKLEIWRVA